LSFRELAKCTRGVDKLEVQGPTLKPSTIKLHERG